MKKFKFLLMAIVLWVLPSCADSISDIESVYQRGIERAETARSPEELTQITIDERNELIDGAKGIGGDRILSEAEMTRYRNAQHRFESAVEEANYRLTGNYGTWSNGY